MRGARAAPAARGALSAQRRNVGAPGNNFRLSTGAAGIAAGEYRSAMHETEQGRSMKHDERVPELFGRDDQPWVHPVKSTTTTGVNDPENYLLWEAPMSSQIPDPRNSIMHRMAQNTLIDMSRHPSKFWQDNSKLGMFPNMDMDDPGAFWKRLQHRNMRTHMVWEQAKERNYAQYGGVFAVPGDTYVTLQGVKPLFSPLGWRNLKHDIHEPIVRELNATVPDATRTALNTSTQWVEKELSGFNDEAVRLAQTHEAMCTFYKTIRPMGVDPSEDLVSELSQRFGSMEGFKQEFISAAMAHDGDGIAWLVYAHEGVSNARDRMEIEVFVPGTSSGSPSSNHKVVEMQGIICCPLHESIWSVDWPSKEVYLDKFFDVIDCFYLESKIADVQDRSPPAMLQF